SGLVQLSMFFTNISNSSHDRHDLRVLFSCEGIVKEGTWFVPGSARPTD
ncbi:UNVERIFIED_ORG: hypothetical protein ABIB52_002453, partial [Arthrobacter sp. UYCu721]